jgi:hypothetical protein
VLAGRLLEERDPRLAAAARPAELGVVRAVVAGVERRAAAASSASSRARTASYSASPNTPRAIPDWLVTTISASPAPRSRASARAAPGRSRTRAGSAR